MPITVKCLCGKVLTAPDAMAGKKAKCPGCGKPVTIPPADGGASAGRQPSVSELETRVSVEPPPSLEKLGIKVPGAAPAAGPARPSSVAPAAGTAKTTGATTAAGVRPAAPAAAAATGAPAAPATAAVHGAKTSAAGPPAAGVAPKADGGTTGERKCGQCGKVWPADTVVCVACGFNMRSGMKLRQKL
ncbi:MAG: hypothetical protein HYZ53_18050 [Planctomycetes bacterium]|nr:hypothetical protein [Planctomycetota bacterium]